MIVFEENKDHYLKCIKNTNSWFLKIQIRCILNKSKKPPWLPPLLLLEIITVNLFLCTLAENSYANTHLPFLYTLMLTEQTYFQMLEIVHIYSFDLVFNRYGFITYSLKKWLSYLTLMGIFKFSFFNRVTISFVVNSGQTTPFSFT